MKKLYSHGVNLGVIAVLVFSAVLINNVSAQTATTTTTSKVRSVAVTSNSKWPVTVQSVRGKNYVTAPFPTKVGEPLSYCEVADDCRTWVNPPGTESGLGVSEKVVTYATINGANTQIQVQIDTPSRLPTFQYSAPFKKFIGRYFDGKLGPWSNVGWIKGLDLVPNKIIYVSQKNKIYISAKTTIMAYNADTFFGAIQNESLKYFYSQHPGSGVYSLGGIPWDAHFFPFEGQSNFSPSLGANAWVLNASDNAGYMLDFDVDDRGYIYMHTLNGFGVAKDSGSIIRPVLQASGGETWDSVGFTASTKEIYLKGSAGTNKVIRPDVDMNKGPVFTFKANNKYYISVGTGGCSKEYEVTCNNNSYTVFDMTDPLKPEFVAEGNSGKQQDEFVRIPSGQDDIIAVETFNADDSSSIEIYKASDFAMGGSPSKTFTTENFIIPGGGKRRCEGYNGLTADKVSGKLYSFSCVKEGTKFMTKLSVFSPANISDLTTYTETKYNLAGYESSSEMTNMNPNTTYITNRSGDGMRFNNGYLTAPVQASYPLPGRVNTNAGAFNGYALEEDIAVWIMRDGKPVKLETNNFTAKYYVNAPEGYAKANTAGYNYSQLMNYGGKDYFFYSGQQQGDVYELEPVSRDVSTTLTTPTSLTTIGTFITNLIECGLGHLFNYKTGALCGGASANIGGSSAPKVMDVKGPTSLSAGQAGVWTITANDPNSDDLSWSVDWGSGRSTASCKLNPGAGASKNWTYTISHSWLSPGAKTVTVYLDDCKGGKTTQTFTVTISGGAGGGGDQQDQNAN